MGIVSADGTETRAYAAVYPLTSSSAPVPRGGVSAPGGDGGGGGGGGGGDISRGGDGEDGSGVQIEEEEGGQGDAGGGGGDGREREEPGEGIHHALWEFHCVDRSTCVSIAFLVRIPHRIP